MPADAIPIREQRDGKNIFPGVLRLLPASALALGTFLLYLPALRFDFLNWDDGVTLVENPWIRGMTLPNLRWAWTTFRVGHYMPLTWMSYMLDVFLGGMRPRIFHLTNVLLHAGSAAAVFFLLRKLLVAARGRADEAGLSLASFLGAAWWAFHPWRVESVAWVSERRDLLSALLIVLASTAWLDARQTDDPSRRRRGERTALGLLVLSLLAKAVGAVFPAALCVLDLYPLRRKDGLRRLWWSEKLPYWLLSAAFLATAALAQVSAKAAATLEDIPPLHRLAQAFRGTALTAWGTLTSSAPLLVYEFPVPLRPFSAPFVLSVVAVLAVAAAFWALRRRRPALAAAGAVFVIFLSPTLGFFQSGPQMLASRYSTLASLAAAALLAGGVLVSRRRAAAVLLAAAWIAFGAFQTRRLLPAWRDGVAFWRASLKESPGSPLAESNLAAALAARGRTAEALAGLDLALSRNVLFPNKKIPIDLEAQRGWLLMKLGRTGEAEASFRRVLADDPANKGTRNNLGLLLTETGRLDDGLRELWSLVEAFPEYPEGHLSLGVALGRAGRGGEALREFATAEKLSPGMAAAPYNRALLLNALGFRREALLAWEKAARADESILPLPEAPRAR